MYDPSTTIGTTPSSSSRNSKSPHLHGLQLLLARTLWVVLVTLSLALYFTASIRYIPHLFESEKYLHTYLLHPDPSFSVYITSQIPLAFLFISSIGPLVVVIMSISSVIWIASGLVIFWRKSDDRMILLVSLGFIMLGVAISPQVYILYLLADQQTPWRLLIPIVNLLGWGIVGLFFYIFPNGRFVPRWMVWVALCFLAFEVSESLPSNSPFSIAQLPSLLLAVVELVLYSSPLIAQFYRYRHISNRVERQQVKWVVYGISLTSLMDIVIFLPPLFFPLLANAGLPRSFYAFTGASVFLIGLNLIPLTIGIATFRYRLWDIDIIINRTLVYGTLTIMLALVYFGLVMGLQTLVHLVTGTISDQPLVIVTSTLAIAALFQPLRRRLQTVIDRRFYRRKYDAARTLAAFSAMLRNEVDLEQLREQLLAVVQETMQPTQVSLWLRQTPSDRIPQTTRSNTLPVLSEDGDKG